MRHGIRTRTPAAKGQWGGGGGGEWTGVLVYISVKQRGKAAQTHPPANERGRGVVSWVMSELRWCMAPPRTVRETPRALEKEPRRAPCACKPEQGLYDTPHSKSFSSYIIYYTRWYILEYGIPHLEFIVIEIGWFSLLGKILGFIIIYQTLIWQTAAFVTCWALRKWGNARPCCKNRKKKNLTLAPVIVWKNKEPSTFTGRLRYAVVISRHKMEMKYNDRGTLLPSRSLQYWRMNHCLYFEQ